MADPGQDREHLRLLAIFHYVVAAMVALFALFPVFHLVLGIMFVAGPPENDPKAALIGWIFIVFSVVWIVTGLTAATCLFLAGRYLRQYERYTFCLVMAGVACLFMPVGTVLGVFTILVLMRPSVQALFGRGENPDAVAQPG